MKTKDLILSLFATTLILSCQKNNSTPPDASMVNIKINSPLDGQLFRSGDTAMINANVTYNGLMHGYEVKVTDTTTGFIIFDYAEHVHQATFDIVQLLPLNGTSPMVLKLEFTAEVDHNGTDAAKTLTLLYEP